MCRFDINFNERLNENIGRKVVQFTNRNFFWPFDNDDYEQVFA